MPRQLITLEEHNAAMITSVADPMLNESRPNGIACPKCHRELCDLHPNRILTSLPPKKSVLCRRCGWSGTRLA